MSYNVRIETRLKALSDYSDIIFVNCPHYTVQFPPAGIAYLCEALKNVGYIPKVLDINILLLQKYKPTGLTVNWEGAKCEYFWQDEIGYREMKNIIDQDIQLCAEALASSQAKVIGFSVNMLNERCTDDLVARIKGLAPDKRIIYGGFSYYHETLGKEGSDLPEAIAIGDGEETIVNYMNRIKSGGSIHGIPGLLVNDRKGWNSFIPANFSLPVDNIYWPRWKEFHIDDYAFLYPQLQIPVHPSRGCGWGRCTFCSASHSNPGYRHRKAENILEEMKYLYDNYGVTSIFLTALQVNGDYEQLDRFCDLVIESGINFILYGQFSITKHITYEFCKKLHQAGFFLISFGMESGSNGTLKKMRKGYNSQIAKNALTACHNAKIITSVNLIAGFPGETEAEFQETLSFLKKNKKVIDQLEVVPILSIHFGSELWNNPQKFGINFEHQPGEWVVEDWVSTDGKNTLEKRNKQKATILNLVQELGIGKGYAEQSLDFSKGHPKAFNEEAFRTLVTPKLSDLFPGNSAAQQQKVLILLSNFDTHVLTFISELHKAEPKVVIDMLIQPDMMMDLYSSVEGLNEIMVCNQKNFFCRFEINSDRLRILQEKRYHTVFYFFGIMPEGFYRQAKDLALKICDKQVVGVSIQGDMEICFPEEIWA